MYMRILIGFGLVAVLGGLAVAGLFGLPSLPGLAELPGLPFIPDAETTVTTSIFPTPTPPPATAEAISLGLPTPTPAPAADPDFALAESPAASTVSQPSAAPAVPASSVANAEANLRAGPGTNYDRIGTMAAGEPLVIVAQTAAGDWYQLKSGAWIAAFLVDGEAGEVPVVVELPAAE